MNVNSLDITANKLSDRLKAEESSGKLKTQDLIEQYAKENNTDDLFTANRDGMALFDGGRKLDISGRHYFRLAIDGIPNISDKLISRINGDEVFVISVPLSYNGGNRGDHTKGHYIRGNVQDMFPLHLFLAGLYVCNQPVKDTLSFTRRIPSVSRSPTITSAISMGRQP